MTTWFWNYILSAAFVGACAAAIYLAAQWGLQRIKLSLRLSAALGVMALFVLPLQQLARLLPKAPPVVQPQTVRIEPVVDLMTAPMTGLAMQAGGTPISLYSVLPFVWLLGALVVFVCGAIRYVRFIRLLQKNSRAVPVRSAQILLREYGCENMKHVQLRLTNAFGTPVSVGLLRPCIYVPAAMLQNEGLPYVLQHECTHIRQRHIAYKMLVQLICVLQWFNPFAWLMQKQVAKACEYACDALVTASMNPKERHHYGAVLLDCATPQKAPYLANAFGGGAKQMYRRLQAVMAPQKQSARHRALVAGALLLVMSAALLAACAAKDTAQSIAALEPAKAPPALSENPAQSDADTADLSQQGIADSSSTASDITAENGLCFPVQDYSYITTSFGDRGHRGTDIVAEKGTQIYAAMDGVVQEAENHESFGLTLLIESVNGVQLRYAGCDSLLVEAGASVKAGQAIATVGNTGYSTGNHLHLEYSVNGTLHDPAELFPEHFKEPA